MAERQPAQRRAGVLDDIGDWMARRNADVHHFARDAEATGRKAWEQATRTGENLAAMRSSDLAVLGAKMLKGGGPPSHAWTQARPQTKNPAAVMMAMLTRMAAGVFLATSTQATRMPTKNSATGP